MINVAKFIISEAKGDRMRFKKVFLSFFLHSSNVSSRGSNIGYLSGILRYAKYVTSDSDAPKSLNKMIHCPIIRSCMKTYRMMEVLEYMSTSNELRRYEGATLPASSTSNTTLATVAAWMLGLTILIVMQTIRVPMSIHWSIST